MKRAEYKLSRYGFQVKDLLDNIFGNYNSNQNNEETNTKSAPQEESKPEAVQQEEVEVSISAEVLEQVLLAGQ